MSELSLTIRRQIAAPVQSVFEAWLDPVMLTRFMVNCTDVTLPAVTTDPTVGGRFSITMVNGDRQIPHAGTYLEITRHTRLVFTWESPFSIDGSTVSIDFAPAGADKTDLTLTHVTFSSPQSRDGHTAGWTKILDMLCDTMVAA